MEMEPGTSRASRMLATTQEGVKKVSVMDKTSIKELLYLYDLKVFLHSFDCELITDGSVA